MDKTIVVVALVLLCAGQISSKDAMRTLATGFLKVLEECKEELELTDRIVVDLYYYWKEEYTNLTRDTGCVIMCMSKKLNLLDASGTIHHGNAKEFAVNNGATEDMAVTLINTVHECEKQHAAVSEDCMRALEVAKCFRTALKKVEWAPTVDIIVGEVLTEV